MSLSPWHMISSYSRITIDKHEIANDRKLSEPLQMQRISREGEVTGPYEYSRFDLRKAHIMGKNGVGSGIGHVGGDRRCFLCLALVGEALLIGENRLPLAI